MTRISNRRIRRLLEGVTPPEPPGDLKARLLADIPEEPRRVPSSPVRRRLDHLAAAATLAAMLGGGLLAYHMLRPGLPTGRQGQPMKVVLPEPTGRAYPLRPGTPRTPQRAGAEDRPMPPAAAPAPVEEKRSASSPEPTGDTAAGALLKPVPDPAPATRRHAMLKRMMDLDQLVKNAAEKEGVSSRGPVENAPAPPAPAAKLQPFTGGTSEPNGQPYGDVFYRSYGTNPFVDTEDDHLSTFGLEVDTGSWGVLQRYLRDGHLPPPEAIRVEEIVNALDYEDPAPRREDFRITAEAARDPWAPGPRYRLIRFAVTARRVAPSRRPPAVLTFVVDTSGSMAKGGRLELVKDALELLLDELDEGDRIAVVTYSDNARVVLEPTSDRYLVRQALRGLHPRGSTNVEAGLLSGYRIAREAFRRGAINRVILCSDGVGNVGATSAEAILDRLRREAGDGIELTAVGVGMGNYNDILLERLADAGDGRYVYVDDLRAARRVFSEELTRTLLTVAEEARAQVEFDPRAVTRWRLVGYENRDIADERFRDPSVDAGEIGAGHTVTAVYEVKLAEGARNTDTLATLHLRWRRPGSGAFREIARTIRVGESSQSWEKASWRLRGATLAARFAEVLRHSYWARDTSLGSLAERARLLHREHPANQDLGDLFAAIRRAAGIGRPGPAPGPGE